jgi:NAD(P)-dependent dehydrogenase (short-subunit alcohol dehydrogenase family)
VDILVTASGVWGFAHVYDLPEKDFMNIVDLNLTGTFRCAKHVSRYMIEHKIPGKMVFVSSNAAWLSQPVFGGYAHYVASKGGVVAMTQEIAKELKRYGIMVNSVAPGGMWTPGTLTNGVSADLPPEKQQELNREIMVQKGDSVPTADSVAIVVYGLCTKMADGMTGECVVADSGHMRNIVSHQPAIEAYPPQA